MLTLNQIKKQLNNIADAHANIKHFHYAEMYDFASSGVVSYPAMSVVKNPHVYSTGVMNYSFNVYIMDLVHKDVSNKDEVHSDCLQTCTDILALLLRDNNFQGNVVTPVTFNDFEDSFDEEVSGYWFALNIRVPYALDKCAIPLKANYNIVDDLGSTVRGIGNMEIGYDFVIS